MRRADQIVRYARSCIDTPFHHQGRVPGVGIDCLGVVVGAARATGRFVRDRTSYGKVPRPGDLRAAFLDHGCEEIPKGQRAFGDFLQFWLGARRFDVHAAICTGPGMIHVEEHGARKVIEVTRIPPFWEQRLICAWRLP